MLSRSRAQVLKLSDGPAGDATHDDDLSSLERRRADHLLITTGALCVCVFAWMGAQGDKTGEE